MSKGLKRGRRADSQPGRAQFSDEARAHLAAGGSAGARIAGCKKQRPTPPNRQSRPFASCCILTMATPGSLSGSPLAAMGNPACAAPSRANARRRMRPEASPRAAGAQRSPGPAPLQLLYNCSAIGTKSVFRMPSSSVTSYPAGVSSSQVSSGSRSRSTARCRLTTSSLPVW